MKIRFVSILVLLVLCGFVQQGFAAQAELASDLLGNQCKAEERAAKPDPLVMAMAVSCSTAADCPCPNLCGCKSNSHTCLCLTICCPGGNCP
jgi:hypothetical protein